MNWQEPSRQNQNFKAGGVDLSTKEIMEMSRQPLEVRIPKHISIIKWKNGVTYK